MKFIESDSQVISLSNDTNTSLVPASEMWRLHIFLRHTSTDNLSSDFRLFGSQNIAFQESTLRLIGMSLFSKMFCINRTNFNLDPLYVLCGKLGNHQSDFNPSLRRTWLYMQLFMRFSIHPVQLIQSRSTVFRSKPPYECASHTLGTMNLCTKTTWPSLEPRCQHDLKDKHKIKVKRFFCQAVGTINTLWTLYQHFAALTPVLNVMNQTISRL